MNIKKFRFEIHGDERGSLIALESCKNVPFDIRRVYFLYGTKAGVRRGFHAHKDLMQIAVVVHGACSFLLDDGVRQVNLDLSEPNTGLLIEPMIWHEMYDFSDDCVLMVLASDFYDEKDYIRNYEEFIEGCK